MRIIAKVHATHSKCSSVKDGWILFETVTHLHGPQEPYAMGHDLTVEFRIRILVSSLTKSDRLKICRVHSITNMPETHPV